MDEYPALEVVRKTGREPFHAGGKPLPFDISTFWQWSSSDLVNNALRGVLAEFIVASAIGCADELRVEWDAYDLKTSDGIKIEVKSGAYIQSWYQRQLSPIQFDIHPAQAWDNNTGTFTSEIKRQADVYVFCLLSHKDQETSIIFQDFESSN